jgi:ATP-dependent DNA helicase RecG
MALVLQRTPHEAAEGLDTAVECRVGTAPLLTRYKNVWMLSPAAVDVVESAAPIEERRARGVSPYRPEDPTGVVRMWLADRSGSPPVTARPLPG